MAAGPRPPQALGSGTRFRHSVPAQHLDLGLLCAQPRSGGWRPLGADVPTAHGSAPLPASPQQTPNSSVAPAGGQCPTETRPDQAQPSDPRGLFQAERTGQGFSPSLNLGALRP